jgi:hypothetical protein
MTQFVDQGQLNRLNAQVVFATINSNGQPLAITHPYLGTEGIRLALDSNATDLLPTMTGMVSSPAPYQSCTLTIAIVKSAKALANQLMQIMQKGSTIIGTVTVYPDVTPDVLQPFTLMNMALETVREMNFAGTEPVIVFTMRGYMLVNQGYFGDP